MNAEPNLRRAFEKELERMESFGCRCGRLSEGTCNIHEYAANVKQHIRESEAAACHGGQCRDELLWRKSIETEVATAYERCVKLADDESYEEGDWAAQLAKAIRALAAPSEAAAPSEPELRKRIIQLREWVGEMNLRYEGKFSIYSEFGKLLDASLAAPSQSKEEKS